MDNNVAAVCNCCMRERKANTQLHIKDKLAQLASNTSEFFIKAEFIEKGMKEHMWVRVASKNVKLERGYIEGTLDNNPSCIEYIKYGSSVVIPLPEIEQILQ